MTDVKWTMNDDTILRQVHIAEIQRRCPDGDSPEKTAAFVQYCRRACMALQAMASATPVTTTLILNGPEIGELGGQRAA